MVTEVGVVVGSAAGLILGAVAGDAASPANPFGLVVDGWNPERRV